MRRPALTFLLFLLTGLSARLRAQHDHPAPEKLGTVDFPTSCKPQVQPDFNRAVALLHSFTYRLAAEGFAEVVRQDPDCAMAHWGLAMTHYHQLWDLPPSPGDTAAGQTEIARAASLENHASARERGYIHALGYVFPEAATPPYSARAERYEAAMHELAEANPDDTETQVFYALALVSNASPLDKSHRKQKQAAVLLDPLFHRFPDHPGIPHYLIHACDNQELAARGLSAARVYAGIAPSAPHALHMPSHIFTRLGLWDDSITSNLAARRAAEQQGDVGEQLHAMDYLVYAYLQRGQTPQASQVLGQLQAMQNLPVGDFKVGYAAAAMPIRFLLEQGRWAEAQNVPNPPDSAQPHVTAIAAWARGLGFAHTGHTGNATVEAATLGQLEDRLRAGGNIYWAGQVGNMKREVEAWSAQASHQPAQAIALLSRAAADEDSIDKLPVTPGPILPAREQLAELFLRQGDLPAASQAFKVDLVNSPGRRRAVQGAAQAEALLTRSN